MEDPAPSTRLLGPTRKRRLHWSVRQVQALAAMMVEQGHPIETAGARALEFVRAAGYLEPVDYEGDVRKMSGYQLHIVVSH